MNFWWLFLSSSGGFGRKNSSRGEGGDEENEQRNWIGIVEHVQDTEGSWLFDPWVGGPGFESGRHGVWLEAVRNEGNVEV